MPSKKPLLPELEKNVELDEAQQARIDSTPDEHRLEVVTWQVNGIAHLIKMPADDAEDAVPPIREFIQDHAFPKIICLQDIRIHREDRVNKLAIANAANVGCDDITNKYEVYFACRGGGQSEYELREPQKYKWNPADPQPKKEISGIWAGVCTLVRCDIDDFVRTRGSGQPTWDVPGRFHILAFNAPHWKVAVVNCFFMESPPQGYLHDLAFTGARLADIEHFKAKYNGKVPDAYLNRFYTPDRKDWLPSTSLDMEALEELGYPQAVIDEMGNAEADQYSEFEFRAKQHEHVVREVRKLRKQGYHVLMIGSMNISPSDWEFMQPKRRHKGFKKERAHKYERGDFTRKFLDESRRETGFCGWDAWKMMNIADPNSHFAIVDQVIKEKEAVIDCQVLEYVLDPVAGYHDGNEVSVSKICVLDLARLDPGKKRKRPAIEDDQPNDHVAKSSRRKGKGRAIE